ncbi:hypothetical protein Vafri_17212 [Volvox africanus]|uniref:Uncharacterized protein n=1 Tax=Volvox africanus TaxID=51714 RepID=A0A8J4BLP3_9CHLO|nr:hypothetical protein Vafri_17212 [Volvox africanus]
MILEDTLAAAAVLFTVTSLVGFELGGVGIGHTVQEGRSCWNQLLLMTRCQGAAAAAANDDDDDDDVPSSAMQVVEERPSAYKLLISPTCGRTLCMHVPYPCI